MQSANVHAPQAAGLPLGVGSASLRTIDGVVSFATEGRLATTVSCVVSLDELLESQKGIADVGVVAVVLPGVSRGNEKALDTPATAQRIGRLVSGVVLVTDQRLAGATTRLASRLVDRGVRCWISTDASALAQAPRTSLQPRTVCRWSDTARTIQQA